MAQSSEITPGSVLTGIFSHLRKYLIFILLVSSLGFALTLYLADSFQPKFAARGIFTATDHDLKADFIFFRTLSDQYKNDENSIIKAIYVNELKLDDGTRAMDVTLHLLKPDETIIQNFNDIMASRNLKAEMPFNVNKKPILSKYAVLLSGGIVSIFTALLLSIFVAARNAVSD